MYPYSRTPFALVRCLQSLAEQRFTALLVVVLCSLGSGCASMTNPVGQGVPVRRLPPEYLASPKDETRSIPLSLLSREKPAIYRVDVGDILGVYVEGALGDKTQPVPFRYPETGIPTPALGYPLPVREDGTLPLPLIKSLYVKGKTLTEIQEAMLTEYTKIKEFLPKENARIIVTLIQPRHIQVLVVRQDGGSTQQSAGGGIFGAGSANINVGVNTGGIGNLRRSTGQLINLPAYENDVLHALTRSGGLPGFDAVNEVVIERRSNKPAQGATLFPPNEVMPPPASAGGGQGGQVIRIPLRLRDGETPPFTPEDILLHDGDIVFIEARDTQVYYVGGLLSPRQFLLPRDFDLSVVDAIALAGGPMINSNATQNNLTGQIVPSGLGSPNPSRVSVIRRTKNRGQIVIQVDLNRAYNDRRENILVQVGDVIIMQESVGESFTRWFTTQFRINLLGTFIRQNDLLGTVNGNLP